MPICLTAESTEEYATHIYPLGLKGLKERNKKVRNSFFHNDRIFTKYSFIAQKYKNLCAIYTNLFESTLF